MNWVKDSTGRFFRRPYYSPEEMEARCEAIIIDHLTKRHGAIEFPITTDDLTVLMETMVDDLDLFADLSQEGQDVEGVTNFFSDRLPKIRVERTLSNPRMVNRLRTTLTHELGHVIFHKMMFDGPRSGSLFDADETEASSNRCKRDRMLEAPQTDWMEWQAGFACGALLMPQGALSAAVRLVGEERRLPAGKLSANSEHGLALISSIAKAFGVSHDAARVRLHQREVLVNSAHAGPLFS